MKRMHKKIVRVILVCTLFLSLTPVPAVAQEGVTIVNSCAAVDHSPADPVSGAPSLLTLILVLSGFNPFIGQSLTTNATGASGDVSGSGVIDMYGVVLIRVPLYQYGKHEFSSFVADHSGIEHRAGVEKGGTFFLVYVDDSEPTCDEDAMRAAAEARMAASQTTTTSSSTTTSSTTSTSTTTSSTTSTTTSTTSTAPPATADSPEPTLVSAGGETTDPAGGGPLPALLIGFGALIALLGGWMFIQSGSVSASPKNDT